MPILIIIAVFIFTFLGGLFALKLKDRLHLVLGLAAGAIIGVAFFDLIPEAIELAESDFGLKNIFLFIAAGFALYLVLDRFFVFHCHEGGHECQKHSSRGKVAGVSLSFHSFIDGLAVGAAFQVSAAVGAIVGTAILGHCFSDGLNIVGLVLKNGGQKKSVFRWLLADALAPVFGIIIGFSLVFSQEALGVVLALFAGSFLYIGAADLLPESHHNHPAKWTTLATLAGLIIVFFIVRLAGI